MNPNDGFYHRGVAGFADFRGERLQNLRFHLRPLKKVAALVDALYNNYAECAT